MSHKRKTSRIGSMSIFPEDTDLINPTPSKRALEEAIIRKKTEVRHGQMDYDRLRPLKGEYAKAVQIKHSNRVKINGDWVDTKFAKFTYRFIENWAQRRSQLEWEIQELEAEIAKL